MTCKGICIRHKASRGYANGHKLCNYCNLFIKWDGVFCPCCGCRLRTGPRHFKYKAKLRIKQKQKEKLMQKAQRKNNSNIILYAQ